MYLYEVLRIVEWLGPAPPLTPICFPSDRHPATFTMRCENSNGLSAAERRGPRERHLPSLFIPFHLDTISKRLQQDGGLQSDKCEQPAASTRHQWKQWASGELEREVSRPAEGYPLCVEDVHGDAGTSRQPLEGV